MGVAFWPLPTAHRNIVLSLLDIDGEPHVLAGCDGASLTTEPWQVLQLVEELLSRARDKRPDARGPYGAASAAAPASAAPEEARALARAVEDWCARHRAGRLLALPAAQRSSPHRRLLLALDAVHATLPRGARPRAAASAARARALVLMQRGAAAEERLLQLADAVPPPFEGPGAAERWLEAVIRVLQDASPEGPPRQSAPHRSPAPWAPPGTATRSGSGSGVRLVGLLVAGPDPPM